MKDFVGQELVVGDFVAFVRPQYRELALGQITSFTPKKVHVSYKLHYANSMNDFLSDPFNLVRIESNDALVIKLKGND